MELKLDLTYLRLIVEFGTNNLRSNVYFFFFKKEVKKVVIGKSQFSSIVIVSVTVNSGHIFQ